MSEFLKGNFQTKNKIEEKKTDQDKEKSLTEKFKTAALGSIGGSMVYVERTDLAWDGEENEIKTESKQ